MPFSPSNSYRKTRGIIRRGTRAAQPAANVVLTGTIYNVTDEKVTERSNGTIWESFSSNVGVTNVQTSATGIGNGADTNDDTLFTYSLPANSMSVDGKSIKAIASGHFATNANTKRTKFWFAGLVIVDSGAVTLSNVDWLCSIEISRIDSTHVSCIGVFTGSNVASIITNTPNLIVADLTVNASVIKITGASTIIGAANDVLGDQMKVLFEN